jgi:hypothetical protein
MAGLLPQTGSGANQKISGNLFRKRPIQWGVTNEEAHMTESDTATSIERIESLIISVRGRKVIVDADLARLYGVTTAALNQAVRRNAARFPPDFAFALTASERR